MSFSTDPIEFLIESSPFYTNPSTFYLANSKLLLVVELEVSSFVIFWLSSCIINWSKSSIVFKIMSLIIIEQICEIFYIAFPD